MPVRTLLTFVSHRDPYGFDPYEDGRHKGPVLTLVDERRFHRVILFGRPHRTEQVERTRRLLRELHPKLVVDVRDVDLADSTDHPEILSKLRAVLSAIRRAAPDDDYSISLVAGTPEIHACWVLICAAGEFPARLLNFQRTVHNGLAGPRSIRELDWTKPLAEVNVQTLSLLSTRRDRWDDEEQQGTMHTAPRLYFNRRNLEQAVLLSRHLAPLLVSGEPGTQKQRFAALIHQISNRSTGPLLTLNCATLPDAFFESALFGDPGREDDGKVRQADGGTLVLLKVQNIPAPLLGRLLKAVEDGYYYGSARAPLPVNVRVIMTTDRDLDEEVRLGRFAADIWRRLQPGMVRLVPLRDRSSDIGALARGELERLNLTLPRPKRFSPAALARLESHAWPSNISELRRVVEQAVLNAESSTLQPEDIDLDLATNLANVLTIPAPRIRAGFSLEDYLRDVKYDLVRSALRKTGNNQSEAARLLGVTPQAVSKYARALKPARIPIRQSAAHK